MARRRRSTRKCGRVVESNYKRAKEILTSTLDKLHLMAEALIKYETIDEQQLKDIMEGRTPRPPTDWDDTLTNKPPKAPRLKDLLRGRLGRPPVSTKLHC